MSIVPILIFFVTLALVLIRPKYLGIGFSACLGGLAAYLFGYVTNADVLEVVRLTWNATLAFVSLVVICFILDKIGIFEWAAIKIIKLSKGSYKKLFINLILFGAIVAAFFSNDGAALILTPIIIAKMRLLKVPHDKIFPFIIAGGFIADGASLPLVTSNLVNIVAADFFHVSYGQYAKHMVVPFIVSVGASLLVLSLLYKKSLAGIPKTDWQLPQENPIKSKLLSSASFLIVVLMFAGCFVGGYYNVPVSLLLMPAAIILSFLAFSQKVISIKSVYQATPFSIIFFALGMFLVVLSLKFAGFIDLLTQLIEWFAGFGNLVATVSTGLIASVLSCFVNNLPAIMVKSLAISHVEWTLLQERLLTMANIIGCDIGPKMFPIGSLATLLWLHLLEKKGFKVKFGYFVKVGIILTLPTVILTLLSLYVWTIWLI